jgi:hypothetical protein
MVTQNNEDELKELIVARLSSLPEDREVSIGSEGAFSRDELIKAVRKGDSIGKKVIEVELNYLQSMKNITQDILSNE